MGPTNAFSQPHSWLKGMRNRRKSGFPLSISTFSRKLFSMNYFYRAREKVAFSSVTMGIRMADWFPLTYELTDKTAFRKNVSNIE
jgi:hypothetical protein